MPTFPRRGQAEPPLRTRDGQRVARLFRQHRLPAHERDGRACDLERILNEDCIEVCESELAECGYAACLIRMPEGGGGIMIAGGQDRGRRRFSLAHELGHYHIPSHHRDGPAVHCADADLRTRAGDALAGAARRREWEANDFATELLMPFQLFARDVGKREATFQTVAALAAPDMYDVSLTAAAWRLVESIREPCALVISVDGQIEWIVRSKAWHYPLAERRRPLPSASAAAAVARGELPNVGAEPVDPMAWLASADGRWRAGADVELLESTLAVPRLRQVLSLLWVTNEDS